MCWQYYNRHSCTHSSFVKTKTCSKKPHCPRIRKEVRDLAYICEHCAARILMSMRAGAGGTSSCQYQYQHQQHQHQQQYRR